MIALVTCDLCQRRVPEELLAIHRLLDALDLRERDRLEGGDGPADILRAGRSARRPAR